MPPVTFGERRKQPEPSLMQRLVAARLPICLGLLCTVLAFSISHQHCGAATNMDAGSAGRGAGNEDLDYAALRAAVLKDDRGGEEAALHLLQKDLMAKEALQLRSSVGRLEKETALLQNEVAQSKKETASLKDQVEHGKLSHQAQIQSHRMDRAKEEVVSERKFLDIEDKTLKKEADALTKAEELADKMDEKLEKEEEALNKRDMATARMYNKRLSNLQQRASDRVDDFYQQQRTQKSKEAEVAKVANSWAEIKAVQGASSNIELKHGKEEDRHRKMLKKAAKLEAREFKLEARAKQLVQKKAELDKHVEDAASDSDM